MSGYYGPVRYRGAAIYRQFDIDFVRICAEDGRSRVLEALDVSVRRR